MYCSISESMQVYLKLLCLIGGRIKACCLSMVYAWLHVITSRPNLHECRLEPHTEMIMRHLKGVAYKGVYNQWTGLLDWTTGLTF